MTSAYSTPSHYLNHLLLLQTGLLETNFSDIWTKMHKHSNMIHLKMSSATRKSFCLGPELRNNCKPLLCCIPDFSQIKFISCEWRCFFLWHWCRRIQRFHWLNRNEHKRHSFFHYNRQNKVTRQNYTLGYRDNIGKEVFLVPNVPGEPGTANGQYGQKVFSVHFSCGPVKSGSNNSSLTPVVLSSPW